MTNNLISAIKALMNQYSVASPEQLTIVQAIDSNNDQIQENTTAIENLSNLQPLYTYKAIISQSGASEPAVTSEMINTFPVATYLYQSAGIYTLDLGVNLATLKTTSTQTALIKSTDQLGFLYGVQVGPTFLIQTFDSTMVRANDIIESYTLTIEAYPA